MWRNEQWRRWMGQAPRQLRRPGRSSRMRKRLTVEALEDRTLLSGGGVSSTTGLIAAINTANSSGVATTITLAEGTTFDFTSASSFLYGGNALPIITGNITIVGGLSDIIERTGPAPIRLFEVIGGGSLTLKDLILQGGWAKGGGAAADGGAIFSTGNLTLSAVTIQNNKAQGSNGANGVSGAGGNGWDACGGGVYVAGGSVSLSNAYFVDNVAQGGNGGNGAVVVAGNGGNGGSGTGGGLDVAGGSVSQSHLGGFRGNSALGGLGGNGGGLFAAGGGGSGGSATGGGFAVTSLSPGAGNLTLSYVNFQSNGASGGAGGHGGTAIFGGAVGNGGDGGGGTGGGLYAAGGGILTLSNDALNSNFAQGGTGGAGLNAGAGGSGAGGGVDVSAASSLTLGKDTLSFNSVNGGNGGASGKGGTSGRGGDADGGGLFAAGGGIVNLSNDTLVSDDIAHGGFGGFGGESGTGGAGGEASGGGLYVVSGGLSLRNDTLSGNAAYGGLGGNGGNGGNRGNGGSGGDGNDARGGGLYAAMLSVTLSNDSVRGNFAEAGNGGNGGNGGSGTGGGNGGNGGNGGDGGDALGGGLYTLGPSLSPSVSLSGDTLSGDSAQAGNAGSGGNGYQYLNRGGHGGVGGAAAGGGLDEDGDTILSLSNDTLSGNFAQAGNGGVGGAGGYGGGAGGAGGAGSGGGLYVRWFLADLSLINDTLSGNFASGGNGGSGGSVGQGGFPTGIGGNGANGGDASGGGLYVSVGSASSPHVVMANTLIAENSITTGLGGTGGQSGPGNLGESGPSPGPSGSDGNASGPDVSAFVNSSDHDLIGDSSGSAGFSQANGDILNPDLSLLGLEPLGYNGGPTQTMALALGSLAIDKGDNSVLPTIASAEGVSIGDATDQRGYARIVGSNVDIGAYEYGATPATPALSISGSGGSSTSPGGPITYTFTLTNNSSTAQSNVDVVDSLPANTTLVSWTAVPGWASSSPPAGSSSGTMTAWIDSLPATSSATFTLVVQVTPGTPVGTVITNTASFAPFDETSNSGTNSASTNTTVLYAPTIQIVDGGIYNGNLFPATAKALSTDGATTVTGTFSYTYYQGSTSLGSTPPIDAGTYTVVANFTSDDSEYSNGSAQITFTIDPATTDFSGLTIQQILTGTTSVNLSGLLTSNTIVPAPNQSVAITFNGLTQPALVESDGSFSASFDTSALAVGTYSISYSYAGDNNFTEASATGSLTIDYGSQLLFNNSKPVHSGAVLPIKLALTDASGTDISSSSIAVTAVGLVDSNGNAVQLNSAGNANPNDLFRYDASLGGYVFNLSTKGLPAGSYTLYSTAGDDPTVHSLTFVVD